MSVLSQFRFLFFFAAIPLVGCSAPVDKDTDELPEIGERIGEVREAVSQGDGDWWKNLSCGDRNQAIVNRAVEDEGNYVGLNCKDWARKVVSDASHGVVTLPSTTNSGYGWQWNDSPYVIPFKNIYGVVPGNIVQMDLPGPHTAIVLSYTGDEICWIESNWYEKTHPKAVFKRCEKIVDFLHRVTLNDQQKYTVHLITGGN